MNPIIVAEGLGKRYQIGARVPYGSLRESLASTLMPRSFRRHGKGTHETIWALRDVSFAINPGEAVGVIGQNGAGKSTLLKILSRIMVPTEGEARLRGRVGRVDFLKVGHHGSRTATSDAWLAELSPKAAVISVGVNRYGHPTEETLGRLAAHGVPFWRTDRDGEVTVSTDGAAMRVCARSGCKAMPVVP